MQPAIPTLYSPQGYDKLTKETHRKIKQFSLNRIDLRGPTQVASCKNTPQGVPDMAPCHGLCSRVHASHFCMKLKLSPHGQLVASCRAPWEPLPQHPFIPSTSLHITFIDSYQFSSSASLRVKFVSRPCNRRTVDLGEPAFNQDTLSRIRSN